MTVWRAGMDAICIADSDGRWANAFGFVGEGPCKDDVLTVIKVGREAADRRSIWSRAFGPNATFLTFSLWNGAPYEASNFRPAVWDFSENDEQVVARIKRCKPSKAPALAPKRHERASLPCSAGSAPTDAPGAVSAQPLHDAARSSSNRFSPFHFEDAE